MAFSGLGRGSGAPHSAPMAEINMIPLVDVMLVLLIIFMITAPLIAHKIKIDLPQASTVLLEERPDTIVIALMADGRMFLNDVPPKRSASRSRNSTCTSTARCSSSRWPP
jgi:biopolymer transport protein ExbD